jgi:hypothetical protein
MILRAKLLMASSDVVVREDGALRVNALLAGAEEDPVLCFDLEHLTTALPYTLLARVERIAKRHRRGYAPAPGHIVVVDNRRAAHALAVCGSGAEAGMVLRSFVVRDLLASRGARDGDGRVIALADC